MISHQNHNYCKYFMNQKAIARRAKETEWEKLLQLKPYNLLGKYRCRLGDVNAKLLMSLLKFNNLYTKGTDALPRVSSQIQDAASVSSNIFFIEFDRFCEFNRIPRCPQDQLVEGLMCPLNEIDRDNSLLVFISHCWLRGKEGTEGWSGEPHPDNANGDKYKLLVEGIRRLKRTFASRVKKVYLWIDYSCMNQEKKELTGDLEHYDEIVRHCDVVFTPIVDNDHHKWSFPTKWQHLFDTYKAAGWCNGPNAYINRAWCRLEMVYAAFIPVMRNKNGQDRHRMFDEGVALHCERSRRPHLLFGTKELEENRQPNILPPLQHSYLETYNPLDGELTIDTDRAVLKLLMETLMPFIQKTAIEPGYKGDRNAKGEKHGVGEETYENGGVFTGEYVHDKKCGLGAYRYANGMIYQGFWLDNLKHGKGFHIYLCGEMYDGEWVKDERSGRGIYKETEGWYEGEWLHSAKHGKGEYHYVDGTVYVGEWKDDVKSGLGTMAYSNGDCYQGEWKNDVKSGLGTYFYSGTNRSVTCQWRNDKMVEME